MKLLPYPRLLKRQSGQFILPKRAALWLDPALPRDEVRRPLTERLHAVAAEIGVELIPSSAAAGKIISGRSAGIRAAAGSANTTALPAEGYTLTIDRKGVLIEYREIGGLRAGVATLRQLLREHGRELPCLKIHDWPDFPRRGVMLDISRGRVPRVETLMELAGHLADFKINELQLYTEHTFAYRKYRAVWRDWGALTGAEIRRLDAHCRRLGIELVPNQNSFGHLRYFLEHPKLKKLAEVSGPYEDASGEFVRRPSTLAPNHPGTIKFLRGLYDELLPNFSGARFNVGCDETWDLGRGQSRELCKKKGRGRVYLDFLKKIHRETSARKKQMMFWGDIILHHPELVRELPRNVIALNWGYEAGHPFDREAAIFARSKVPFYVCPGTSTWMTLIGRHDNAFANLREAAKAGRKHGAAGFLITDWGDGGHPQPLAASYAPYLFGAAVSWCAATADEALLDHVLNRDVFEDATGHLGRAALGLGLAHRKFKYRVVNLAPFGAVIAAPPPEQRELFCRDGLKYYARISGKNIRAALKEVELWRGKLRNAQPGSSAGRILARELDLAARMAAQSCQYMLWQQARAAGRVASAGRLAIRGITELRRLEREFVHYWPLRNKGTPAKCAPFLHWRREDYGSGLPSGKRRHYAGKKSANRLERCRE